jgi:hypothetical protein
MYGMLLFLLVLCRPVQQHPQQQQQKQTPISSRNQMKNLMPSKHS